MTTAYFCFRYLSYILCINHITASASVFYLILTLAGQGTHSTQNRKLYINIVSRQNIHTFITTLYPGKIYIPLLFTLPAYWWHCGNEFSCKSKLILLSSNWRRQWAILIVIYNRKSCATKLTKFSNFRSEIIIFSDDVCKISI